jgi:hypothetical protein
VETVREEVTKMMPKEITLKWLKEHRACCDALIAFCDYVKKNKRCKRDPITILRVLLRKKGDTPALWASWLLARLMNKRQSVMYALHAAKSVVHHTARYEKAERFAKEAIKRAEAYLRHPCDTTKEAACDAGLHALNTSAVGTLPINCRAEDALLAASYAAYAAAGTWQGAQEDAEEAAQAAVWATKKGTQKRREFIRYGIKILTKKVK